MDFWFEFLNIPMNEKTIISHGFKWKNINIDQILTFKKIIHWVVTTPN
jgi:hypothetical protein